MLFSSRETVKPSARKAGEGARVDDIRLVVVAYVRTYVCMLQMDVQHHTIARARGHRPPQRP